jgi:hypothetical protein
MRFLVATLLACFVFTATAAFAGNAYEDVPRDHWAYNALDYLTDRGVLEGYPDGFFKGDRTLTRYEFAQAIARLLDSIGTPSDENIRIMAETLRAEFSDQLAELQRSVNEIGTQMNGLDARIGDLEGAVADNSSRIGDLEGKVSGLNAGPNWKGEFRYRWQFEERDVVPDSARFRQRIRFRLGYATQIHDAVKFAFRLETATGANATSGNHTLGNNGKTADIYLDQAYVVYTPSWFGYYTACDHPVDCNGCETCGCPTCTDCNPKIEIYAGLFPNIFEDHNEMILDDDVNMQGLGVVYHFNEDFQIATAASVAVEVNGADYFDDDTYLFVTELKHTDLFTDGLDAWVGAYGWKNEGQLPAAYFAGNSFNNFDFNNDGVIDGNDRFSTNFHTVKGGLQYTFDCWWDKPMTVYGEYMVNIEADADDRIAAANPFINPNFIYEDSDDFGWVVGAQYGQKPKYCKDWTLFASYKEIGANVIIDGFGDADAGGANVNSLEVGWQYMWADNSLIGITYFLNKMHNAFGFLIPNNAADQSIIQVDWTFKF